MYNIYDWTYHHLGLFFITLAFLFLATHVLMGNKIQIPKLFFILYSIGGLFLIYEMHMKQAVMMMELVGVICSIFLAFRTSIM